MQKDAKARSCQAKELTFILKVLWNQEVLQGSKLMMKFTSRRSDAGGSMEDILEKIKMSQRVMMA